MAYRKLSPDIYPKIIEDPRPYKDIALSLGIHKDSVGRIKRKHQWEQIYREQKHIQERRTK